VIETKNNGPKNYYIKSATLNNTTFSQPWLLHEALVKGGKLVLEMSDQPNKAWGSDSKQAPPSMSSEK
jgi:putative alpha-1,2-mannosidase